MSRDPDPTVEEQLGELGGVIAEEAELTRTAVQDLEEVIDEHLKRITKALERIAAALEDGIGDR